MKLRLTLIFLCLGVLGLLLFPLKPSSKDVLSVQTEESYWFLLKRKSNVEYLYKGVPGNTDKSEIIKIFNVKTGIPNERPTPLPEKLGREYWVITKKYESKDNPETSPYFLSLDIPVSEYEPYGPTPYDECGGQCNWVLPGEFGLHGVGGDSTKLSVENNGSSGCIRHSDEGITYLYHLLEVEDHKIRYYIEDV